MTGSSIEGGFRKIFLELTQKSSKVSSYFAVYDALLTKYKHKRDLVLVEVGVMNGGSLFMWQSFFGNEARIIGVDFSPTALAMREKGFEIFIGDQSSPDFWRAFFEQVGKIDILVDDGGHRNKQQILTIECCLDNIRDGGMIIVEDVCASYMPAYGNPSRYSFMNYCKFLIDKIQARGPIPISVRGTRFSSAIFSISFFESIVCFNVDRRLCGQATTVTVGHEEIGAVNYWNVDNRGLVAFDWVRRVRRLLNFAPAIVDRTINEFVVRAKFALENWKLRRFF